MLGRLENRIGSMETTSFHTFDFISSDLIVHCSQNQIEDVSHSSTRDQLAILGFAQSQ